MITTFRIAARNLLRYKRRTALTMTLIVAGMAFVLVFAAVTGSFRSMMIGQITDSFLGHIQIHRRGYLASIDSLPLNLNLGPKQVALTEKLLAESEGIAASSPRLKFGAGLSNFRETTNIRINGVEPSREFATCPLLLPRMVQGKPEPASLHHGALLVPELLAKGLGLKVGDSVVIVATNQDGAVNGGTFVVGGVLESATGPGGRDGYMHIDDARELLRIDDDEVSEYAVRVRDFSELGQVLAGLQVRLAQAQDKQGWPVLQAHGWESLSPFANIARMIDVMSLSVKLLLIALVLISIMNVMLMAVYERVREIGTVAAIGTLPGRILALHVAEGFLLGTLGAAAGTAAGLLGVAVLNFSGIRFAFGRQQHLLLAPSIAPMEVLSVSGLVVAIAVIASLQPAWKASRMTPIDALRHV